MNLKRAVQHDTVDGPKAAPPCYPKEHYDGGKDVNRDANCAPNVNNPSK
jgi:hypothetical protein